MKRPHDMRRGNDLLYKPRGDAEEFDLYLGPFGGDMRQSMAGPTGRNCDEAGGDQLYNKKGKGLYGPSRTRSTRKDESDY